MVKHIRFSAAEASVGIQKKCSTVRGGIERRGRCRTLDAHASWNIEVTPRAKCRWDRRRLAENFDRGLQALVQERRRRRRRDEVRIDWYGGWS